MKIKVLGWVGHPQSSSKVSQWQGNIENFLKDVNPLFPLNYLCTMDTDDLKLRATTPRESGWSS